MVHKYTFEGETLVAQRAEVPVFWQGDVIVAGGGPAGLGAAIAARRSGARTLLIERHAFLGGMCSFGSGMPLGGAYPAGRSIGGIAEEILTRVRNAGPESADVREIPHFGRWYYHDSEYFKSLAGEIIAEEDVDVLLHTTVVDAVMDGSTMRGLVIQNKSGRQAVLAKAFVDCTGDADVAAFAGAEYIKGRPEDGAMMAVTLPYIIFNVDVARVMDYLKKDPAFEKARLRAAEDGLELSPTDRFQACAPGMRPDHFFSNIIRITGVDGTDAVSLTNAEFEARKRIRQHITFFRKYVPGCENSYVGHTSEQMGIRDTRRIIGEARLETEACLKCTKPKTPFCAAWAPLTTWTAEKAADSSGWMTKATGTAFPTAVWFPKGWTTCW